MHEVTERSVSDSLKERMWSLLLNPVPTDLRHDEVRDILRRCCDRIDPQGGAYDNAGQILS